MLLLVEYKTDVDVSKCLIASICFTQKLKLTGFYERSVTSYQSTLCRIQVDLNLQQNTATAPNGEFPHIHQANQCHNLEQNNTQFRDNSKIFILGNSSALIIISKIYNHLYLIIQEFISSTRRVVDRRFRFTKEFSVHRQCDIQKYRE